MDTYKEVQRSKLAILIKDWDLAGKLVDEYLVFPRPEKEEPTSELGYLVLPLPETKIWKDEDGDLYIGEELVTGNGEFWRNTLEDNYPELNLITEYIASAVTALAAIEDEKISSRRNELAIKFGHLPGYDVLPEKSPLREAIDYIITNTEKEEIS